MLAVATSSVSLGKQSFKEINGVKINDKVYCVLIEKSCSKLKVIVEK